ncbi:DUF2913 family protein [Shewanella woodyi]|uniref:DUF2913 family protein n=1 Tax=Shewanella woodyi (strain ATCC 51908 / MS32) TaxID=392500 RepID=B1KH78_SHEWM|nr:DUF2913 family protein [Shewanella woodyi]ACA85386.1 conserved hypothetical protein [Shewanella woodyi ATCC 51908]
MTEQTYNQALLELVQAGLSALKQRAAGSNAINTATAESHFLCSWMVQALKERRFAKLVAQDLTRWIREARSKGAGAQLPSLFKRIDNQYSAVLNKTQLGDALQAMLTELEESDWLVILDAEVDTKLKLDSDGRCSLIISVEQYQQRIKEQKIVKPITLYVRADEQLLAQAAAKHGLLISQGDKKASLIKHHKAYQVYPGNRQPALALLLD